MGFENDFIMRMIKDMVRTVAAALLGKTALRYESSDRENNTEGDDLYARIIALADQGMINEAENILYENLNPSSDISLETGLGFYSHINEYDDDFLEEHNYSREEISQGLRDYAAEFGFHGLNDLFI